MVDTALTLVRQYIDAHLEEPADYALFVVFQTTVLQNQKFMIACTLQFGMLFDLTFDADLQQWYMNVYSKIETQKLKEARHAVSEQQAP